MSNLLARYAEAAFWMGRYVERAESLARIIDVNDTFSRNSRGIANWDAVLQLYCDEERFRERHGDPEPDKVVFFYLFDQENPGSVASSVRFARENARTLRPMISSEIWEQLNTFNNKVSDLDASVLESPGLYRVCNFIKERCQMHAGVVEATMHRDETWYFCQLGKQLERGAQTAHYLDVRYHDLQPGGDAVDPVQWMALLRSQAALHGYRQTSRRGVTPRGVANFLLFNRRFPRSVASCVHQLSTLFGELRESFELEPGGQSAQALDTLHGRIREQTIDQVIEVGLHEFLDRTQLDIYGLSDRLREDFFAPST